MQVEYIHYNDVLVKLFDEEYPVSFINTKTNPKVNDFKSGGPFLSSVEITPPLAQTGGDNTNPGSKGTVELVDYKNILFNKFVENSRKTEANPQNRCPKIVLIIGCYTGTYTYAGSITEWSMSFDGSVPKFSLTWTGITPTVTLNVDSTYKKYSHPSAFISDAKKMYSSDSDTINYQFEGGEVDQCLKFRNGEVTYSPAVTKSHGNRLIDAYRFLDQSVVSLDGTKTVIGALKSDDPKVYLARFREPDSSSSNQTENGVICNNLIFVQNGKHPAYTEVLCDDGKKRHVIPMTSFSFSADLSNVVLMTDIIGNENGTQSDNGKGATTNSSTTQNAVCDAQSSAAQSSISSITFSCYNVMSFDMNNMLSPIKFDVYTEFGEKHPVSGIATVQSVTYKIEGGIVNASVKATKAFGQLITTVAEKPEQKQEDKPSDNSGTNSSTSSGTRTPGISGATR